MFTANLSPLGNYLPTHCILKRTFFLNFMATISGYAEVTNFNRNPVFKKNIREHCFYFQNEKHQNIGRDQAEKLECGQDLNLEPLFRSFKPTLQNVI